EKPTKELNTAFVTLASVYKRWVEQQGIEQSTFPAFLETMQRYFDDKVIFLSPSRGARYYVSYVDGSKCSVERIDGNEPIEITESRYEARTEFVNESGGSVKREKFDATVAVQMAMIQGARLGLAANQKHIVRFRDFSEAAGHLKDLVLNISSPQLYKPAILKLIVDAVASGDLNENKFQFDWLSPRFISFFKRLGRDVDEQQLAEGFGRLAKDMFWVLAHKDPNVEISSDKPTPAQIRERISHASLQEPYWRVLQTPKFRQLLVDAICKKWPSVIGEVAVEPTNENLQDAIETLFKSISDAGFVYQPWQIATYVTALRTKPFVILAGVSGTGKSKLPKLVSDLTSGAMKRVSVRPDWTDSSEVLGYLDLQNNFRPGAVIQAASNASQNGADYHVCLVDEMNLARVEHYFAEVLSTIEDRHQADGGGFESTRLLTQELPTKFANWQHQILPANFGIVGTVNMDESSHGFSRKVLDRAFTIELSEVELGLESVSSTKSEPAIADWPIGFWHCKATRLSQVNWSTATFKQHAEKAIDLLQELNHCLVHSQLQVGYRTRDEVVLFLLNAEEVKNTFRTRDDQPVDPLDLAILMKILPRVVGGSSAIRRTLGGLLGVTLAGSPLSESEADAAVATWDGAGRPNAIPDAQYARSCSRLCLMWERLRLEGYTSFWL
ncbi:MAG: AAA family ATPase, partial [Planctomycetota bacterium]